jgi:hypothetical protein
MYLIETGCDDVGGIQTAESSAQWLDIVNMATNIQIP